MVLFTSSNSAASLADTQAALNAVASPKGFSCKSVSWEDAQRGTVGGMLSCWGANISDVRLWAKDGALLYTLRSDNWNERLGYVASKDVAVVVGNHVPGGAQPTPITLQRYMKNFKEYAGYAGATSEALFDDVADRLLTIRFQAVFLPIADTATAEAKGAVGGKTVWERIVGSWSSKAAPPPTRGTEFCTEVYNYNTRSDDNPRNVILLCSAQGTSVQQDGAGAKKVFLHTVDANKVVHRHWLEAERSTHKVGGAQEETEEEAAAAAARGKATAIHVGTKAMGTRFNVQMLIQLPVKQKQVPMRCYADGIGKGGSVETLQAQSELLCNANKFCKSAKKCGGFSIFGLMDSLSAPRARRSTAAVGTSNAARVSVGSEQDSAWAGLAHAAPVRDPSQHGTITVTLYYTVAGGVPSPADVEACMADIDALYKACPSDKRLVDCADDGNGVTAELTVKDVLDIKAKQPYVPAIFPPTKSSFPEDE